MAILDGLVKDDGYTLDQIAEILNTGVDTMRKEETKRKQPIAIKEDTTKYGYDWSEYLNKIRKEPDMPEPVKAKEEPKGLAASAAPMVIPFSTAIMTTTATTAGWSWRASPATPDFKLPSDMHNIRVDDHGIEAVATTYGIIRAYRARIYCANCGIEYWQEVAEDVALLTGDVGSYLASILKVAISEVDRFGPCKGRSTGSHPMYQKLYPQL